jgi:hypothetical protein
LQNVTETAIYQKSEEKLLIPHFVVFDGHFDNILLDSVHFLCFCTIVNIFAENLINFYAFMCCILIKCFIIIFFRYNRIFDDDEFFEQKKAAKKHELEKSDFLFLESVV